MDRLLELLSTMAGWLFVLAPVLLAAGLIVRRIRHRDYVALVDHTPGESGAYSRPRTVHSYGIHRVDGRPWTDPD